MLVLAVLAALVAGWVGRYVLARRARTAFCKDGEGCVTLALLLKPGKRGLGWRHGFARLNGDLVEWRAEYKLGGGADLTFRRNSLRVREHRPVRKGEAMLSELCELISARYQDEEIQLSVPRTELATFLAWPRG